MKTAIAIAELRKVRGWADSHRRALGRKLPSLFGEKRRSVFNGSDSAAGCQALLSSAQRSGPQSLAAE